MNTILKWAGNKRLLAPEILSLVKKHRPGWIPKRIVEPFMGGGGFFVHARNGHSYLASDNNYDLINMYRQVRDCPKLVVFFSRQLFEESNNESEYYEIRKWMNEDGGGTGEVQDIRRACVFLYLNRHCFNGLCRYNKSGGFNVPYGKYKSPYFPEKEIYEFSKLLHAVRLISRDFREVIDLAMHGDLVYCDPPYVPTTATASFTGYSGTFGWEEQLGLLESAVAASERGALVVLSNSDTPATRALYCDATAIHEVSARRSISANGDSRKNTTELVVFYG